MKNSMPVNKAIIVEIDKSTWLIDQFGTVISYALLGEKRGLIIDAGSGLLNINDLAERLFQGKPYSVIYTHLNSLTAGGYRFIKASQYAHHKELEKIANLKPIEEKIDKNVSLHCPKYDYQFGHIEELKLDEIIDLGNRNIIPFLTSGVSEGNISLFDQNTKIVFSGNVLSLNMELFSFVSDEFVSLQRLKSYKASRIYPSYLSFGGYRSFKRDLLDEAISCIHACLHPSGRTYLVDGSDNIYRFNRITIKINKDKIWRDYESQSPYPIGI